MDTYEDDAKPQLAITDAMAGQPLSGGQITAEPGSRRFIDVAWRRLGLRLHAYAEHKNLGTDEAGLRRSTLRLRRAMLNVWQWLEGLGGARVRLDALGPVAASLKLLGDELDADFGFPMAQNDDASAGQDTVTGLPNAGTAALTIAAAIERANRDGSKFPIFSLSISRLNTINQAFGRDAGDAVLREFGQRLADAGDGSAACIAGNCFIFVGLPAETNASFDVIRDRVVARLAEPFGFSGERHQLSSAIGLAIFPEHGREPAELLQAANFARRLSKADGGNSVVVWDLAKAQEGSARFALENELRGAARRGELRLFYQPKVKMPGARLVGFEALLRWQHPVHGLLTPGAFLDIAEEANIMRPLTKWAYKQVGRQLRAWIDAGLAAVPVAINTPPSEFTGNLLGEHLHEFERHGVPTRLLEIEITESKMTEDIARFCEVGEVLKQRGIKVAMDDFGTGYSCLSTLGKLPITTLKIDYIFTSQLLTGRASRAIAVAILSIAREMDVEVVAEGVETPEQLRLLRSMGCSIFQGYLTGRPMPAEEATKLLPPARRTNVVQLFRNRSRQRALSTSSGKRQPVALSKRVGAPSSGWVATAV